MKNKINQLITRGGKFLGIDLNYFIKGSFWTGIPLFTEVILKVIITVIFTRMVTMAVYGEYRFYMSILFTLSLFSLPGIGSAIIRSVARKHSRSFLDGTKTILKFSLIGSIAFLIIASYFYFTGRHYLILYFLFTAALFPLLYSFKTYSFFLIGKEEYKKHAKYFMAQIVLMNSLFLLAIILSKNLTIIILVYLLSTSFSNILIYSIIKKRYWKEIKKSKKDPGLSKYGIHLSLIEVIPYISRNIDKILITYFLGFKVVAIYAIAQTMAQQNKLAIRPLFKIILPKLSKQKNSLKTYKFLRKKIWYMIGLSSSICVMGIILSPILINILFTSEYNPSIFYAQLLFLAYIFEFPTIVFKDYLTAQKMTKVLYKSMIYPNAIKIIMLLILLPIFGIFGAIASVIIGNYFLFGQLLYSSKKVFY